MSKVSKESPGDTATFLMYLPPELLAKIDQAATDADQARVAWMRTAAREKLERDRRPQR